MKYYRVQCTSSDRYAMGKEPFIVRMEDNPTIGKVINFYKDSGPARTSLTKKLEWDEETDTITATTCNSIYIFEGIKLHLRAIKMGYYSNETDAHLEIFPNRVGVYQIPPSIMILLNDMYMMPPEEMGEYLTHENKYVRDYAKIRTDELE